MSKITFGTDGWRGLIADDFTYHNVEIAGWAIASYIKESLINERGVVVGYDTRFGSKEFAIQISTIFLSVGIDTYLVAEPTPTPVITSEVISRGCDLGIIITASHNDWKWNGIKLRNSKGLSLDKEDLNLIEKKSNSRSKDEITKLYSSKLKGLLTEINPKDDYLELIRSKLPISEIRKSDIRIVTDNMYGTTLGYLESLLDDSNSTIIVDSINNYINPIFPDIVRPEPIEINLKKIAKKMKKEKYEIGFAFDADGDRLGIIDENGRVLETYEIFLLLLYYMFEINGKRDPIARSLSVSHSIDTLAANYNVPVLETPIGFKYLSKFLNQKKVMFAGEESGGFGSIQFPDRDGIINSVFILDLIRQTGLSITKILDEIHSLVGKRCFVRKDINFDINRRKEIHKNIMNIKSDEIHDYDLSYSNDIDGIKYAFNDGSWVLVRISGTENVVRIYCESKHQEITDFIINKVSKLITIE
tara:strand:+ start:4639 stop:6060 length:1422 start_codon:yes stop_codon:yes gene_type:complete